MINLQNTLLSTIRTVPDWPKPGVHFRDITPVFQSPKMMAEVIAHLVERYRGQKLDAVAGIEARGFVFGAVL
ncbi:MAG: adenine phosphoribosyltransferase, partial [Arenimonas sp.]